MSCPLVNTVTGLHASASDRTKGKAQLTKNAKVFSLKRYQVVSAAKVLPAGPSWTHTPIHICQAHGCENLEEMSLHSM